MSRWIILLTILLSNNLFAQKSGQDTSKMLIEKDSVFWVGYNTCNLDLMAQFLAKDLEFYHDKGGSVDIEGFTKAMRSNICGHANKKVRRELIPGTFKLFLLKDQNIIYGAIISYDHYFYISRNGGKESRDVVAKFTSLWLLKEGEWKMHRIFSFDHKSDLIGEK